jgi:hypothetical protein
MREISEMRPKRFSIRENTDSFGQGKGKLNPAHSKAIPNASWYPGMAAYDHYRTMVMVASLPDEPKIATASPVQDHPFSAGYSDADQQMIDTAAKLCGFKPAKLSSRYSQESEGVHKHSPVNHNGGQNKS